MMNRKRFILLAISLILILIIIYKYPKKIHMDDVLFYSLDGENIEAEIKVYKKKFLTKASEIRGNITVNGEIYTNSNTEYYSGDLFSRFYKKYKNYINIPVFSLKNPEGRIGNILVLKIHDDNFELVEILLSTQNKSQTYYGPADTADKAQTIYEKLHMY